MSVRDCRGAIHSARWLVVLSILILCWAWPVKLNAQAISDINLEWLEKSQDTQDWGEDPFVLPRTFTTEDNRSFDGSIRLSAIIHRKGKGVAIINNRIVRKGDTLRGMKVVAILKDRVKLRDGTGEHELRLNPLIKGESKNDP